MVTEPQLIRLIYRRDSRRETFSGTIGCPDDTWSSIFSYSSFERMLELVAIELRRFPDTRLFIKREEAPYPMALPASIENLLRTDLPRAVELLTLPPQRIVIGGQKREVAVLGILRYGNETLADALGETVYVKLRQTIDGYTVEDPITGRWVGLTQVAQQPLRWGLLSLEEIIVAHSGRWGTVLVEKLLTIGVPRYYLPRGWNLSGGWITHEDLVKLYDTYQKEKANVC